MESPANSAHAGGMSIVLCGVDDTEAGTAVMTAAKAAAQRAGAPLLLTHVSTSHWGANVPAFHADASEDPAHQCHERDDPTSKAHEPLSLPSGDLPLDPTARPSPNQISALTRSAITIAYSFAALRRVCAASGAVPTVSPGALSYRAPAQA